MIGPQLGEKWENLLNRIQNRCEYVLKIGRQTYMQVHIKTADKVKENVKTDVPDNAQDNMQENMQENVQANVQDNVQTDERKGIPGSARWINWKPVWILSVLVIINLIFFLFLTRVNAWEDRSYFYRSCQLVDKINRPFLGEERFYFQVRFPNNEKQMLPRVDREIFNRLEKGNTFYLVYYKVSDQIYTIIDMLPEEKDLEAYLVQQKALNIHPALYPEKGGN